jgi:hypothetical protein
MRLANMDFDERFREPVEGGAPGDVAFYPVSPLGLQTVPFKPTAAPTISADYAMQRSADSLMTLASETDGIAHRQHQRSHRRHAPRPNDVRAYYVLGYYTTNTKWDARIRNRIKVKLKPKLNTIRARRQYLAPTLAEIAALSNPAASQAVHCAVRGRDRAGGALARSSDDAIRALCVARRIAAVDRARDPMPAPARGRRGPRSWRWPNPPTANCLARHGK